MGEGAYRGYEFNLFLSKSRNEQLWLDLFKRIKDDKVESFFDDMKDGVDEPYLSFLEKHEPSRFKRFLENSYIWIDYLRGDFERIIERDKKTRNTDLTRTRSTTNPFQKPGFTKQIYLRQIPYLKSCIKYLP